MSATTWHRFQFAFTITYHYLFPQLTMGLALLIVIWKSLSRWTQDAVYDEVARFWAKVFGLNFVMGVVTGIPMEFQFGTNWSRFSQYAGGIIGLTLAMEGMFAFFAESAFLGLFLFGESRLGPRRHFATAVMMLLGSWLSGYFIITTNAFMQHPVGYAVGIDGRLVLTDLWAYLANPWALSQYAHNMCASVVTAAFVVAALGSYWLLAGMYERHARACVKLGIITGALSCVLLLFPTGDHSGKMVAEHQRPALAAMEGKFESSTPAELVLIGQPDVAARRLENRLYVPIILSFLAYGSFGATVYGLNDIPPDQWPDNVELLYYAYHIMVGLGTLFLPMMAAAAFLLVRGRLYRSRSMLWILMLAFPFPYIATTAGWMTAELGRQPWTVYGLQRTAQAASDNVSAGNVAFSTLGFLGMYLVLGVLFLALLGRHVAHGPLPSELPPATGPVPLKPPDSPR